MSVQDYQHFWSTVVSHTKGFCLTRDQAGQNIMCKVKGSLFEHDRQGGQTVVGDEVLVQRFRSDNYGLVCEIKPRRSVFQRMLAYGNDRQLIAANIDLLAIVISAKNPQFKINLLVRFLVAAYFEQIHPLVIISKTDLVAKSYLSELTASLKSAGIDFLAHSIKHDYNLADFKKQVKAKKNVLFIGQSGVGKTSLLNHLCPDLKLKVGVINAKTQKGRHTTTLAKVVWHDEQLNLIDTPGFREFRPVVSITKLGQSFLPYKGLSYNCRMKNCQHVTEPHCAVKQALAAKQTSPALYNAYQKFYYDEIAASAIRHPRRR